MAAALLVALGALAGMITLIVRIRGDENTTGTLGFASSTPAAAPFAEFAQARVAVGARCLRVLVATTPNQRAQGLRDVTALAPYAGMLFVFPGATTARFTMAETPLPLEATFYSDKGVPVDDFVMTPCPKGTDSTCPAYSAKTSYRYALERPAGSGAASGSLGACAA